jgi:hypothetical protein
MRAYDLAMMLIFVNCAFAIIAAMGITTGVSNQLGTLNIINALYLPLFTVAGIDISGLTILAVAMAAGTVIVVGTNLVTDRGIAMTLFTAVFWGSFTTASLTIMEIIYAYPGFTIFWGIFLLGSTLIFIMALIQFPTGGQGAHI